MAGSPAPVTRSRSLTPVTALTVAGPKPSLVTVTEHADGPSTAICAGSHWLVTVAPPRAGANATGRWSGWRPLAVRRISPNSWPSVFDDSMVMVSSRDAPAATVKRSGVTEMRLPAPAEAATA